MKFHPAITPTCTAALLFASMGRSAVSTGLPFYGAPPDEHHPWAVHDQNRPQPKRIEPGSFSSVEQPGTPPSDAIVLFDGTTEALAKWEADSPAGEPTKWVVKDGAMECVPKSGYIRSKQQLGDCQLHVEWAAPKNVQGDSQGRGNSGIFLMGLCEVQVLDNYDNPTYADGFAASVYGVNPPLANALRPPGEFQVIDIVFRRPVYQTVVGGFWQWIKHAIDIVFRRPTSHREKVLDPGYVTVFCNGVLMQDHTPLEGPTGHLKRAVPGPFPAKGPLKLQDHGNPVRYRNIWYRDLPPRAVEGGTDGVLSTKAATAKRKEIAASIRADAAGLTADSTAQMLRLAESLVYERDAATRRKVEQMLTQFAGNVKSLSSTQLEAKKDEVNSVIRALMYMAKVGIVPASFGPKVALAQRAKAAGWETPKK